MLLIHPHYEVCSRGCAHFKEKWFEQPVGTSGKVKTRHYVGWECGIRSAERRITACAYRAELAVIRQ